MNRRHQAVERLSQNDPHKSANPGVEVETEIEIGTQPETKLSSPCKVILFNDEEHTYDYVVEMLTQASRLSRENAFRCAVEVDLTGRTIVHYGTREECERVQGRIRAYGPDHRLPQSMNSMNAEVQRC